MSACTDLIDSINAIVVDPNIIVNVDPTTIAVLSNIGTTETAVSLGAGGPVVLSVPASPSVDGVLCRLTVSGKFHVVSGSRGLGLYLGSSATLGSDQQIFAPGAQGGTGDFGFFWSSLLYWDSVSQLLNFTDSQLVGISGGSPVNISGVTSQTSLQFVVSGKFSVSNASNSVTITQFKLETV